MKFWLWTSACLLALSTPPLAFAADGMTSSVNAATSPKETTATPATAKTIDYLVKDAPAVALHGAPKYPADFHHFNYANPNAIKGGDVTMAAFGSFDSLNPFILKGTSPGLSLIYQSLMVQSADEAFTMYGEIAQSITIPKDRSWVEFTLRPEARWQDGVPLTAEDVAFTFNILKEKGHPFYKSYYADVASVTVLDATHVRFNFAIKHNHELPLIMAQLTILPKHYWAERDFTKTTLEPPLGSGAYKISAVDPGRSISFEHVKDWWAKDLPINRGMHNFGKITFDYFRDAQVMLEAFKAGKYDFRQESIAKNWATAYDIPAVKEGRIQKAEIPNANPQGMQAFVFNLRRPLFQDIRVRHALALMMDFEWMNKNLFYGQYKRTESFFANSELAATGTLSERERAYLTPFKDQLDPSVFDDKAPLPKTSGTGQIRKQLRQATALLKQAGWEQQNGTLTNQTTGNPFEFEILLVQPSFERVTQAFVRNLERLGIKVSIRIIDSAQYTNRVAEYDYDMIVGSFGQSVSPGNEQRDYWGSVAADRPGGLNLAGIKNPVIDQLITHVIHAASRDDLLAATHALDRVLMSGWYMIPQWHVGTFRVAWWNRFGRPEHAPKYSIGFTSTWWVDPEKDAELKR